MRTTHIQMRQKTMKSALSTRTGPAEDRAIASLASEFQATEVWLFGSAVGSDERQPDDVDVALLGVPDSARKALHRVLHKEFPSCRVDDFAGYTVGGSTFRSSSPRLHFVLADDSRDFWSHPISRSIHRGICLWRAG